MTTAMVNIRVAPRRMLSLRDAAEYCGYTPKKFPAATGISPLAMPYGQNLYDIKDLDAWLDALKKNDLDSNEAIIGKLRQCRT